jgi:hypothetical protein
MGRFHRETQRDSSDREKKKFGFWWQKNFCSNHPIPTIIIIFWIAPRARVIGLTLDPQSIGFLI